MPARRFTDAEEREIALLYQGGRSTVDLGDDLNVAPGTIVSALERQGVIRRAFNSHIIKKPEEIQFIVKAYADGVSKTNMQKIHAIDWKTVTKYVAQYLNKGLDDDLTRNTKIRLEALKEQRREKSTAHVHSSLFKHWRTGAAKRGFDWELEIEDLENMYGDQNGRCFYSYVVLACPKTSAELEDTWGNPYKISLDRVDSDKGYIKGNVVLCAASINLGKRDHNVEVFKAFLLDVVRNLSHSTTNHESVARTEDSLAA